MAKDHLYSSNKYVDSTKLELNSEYKRAVAFKYIIQILAVIISLLIGIVAVIFFTQNNVKINHQTYAIQKTGNDILKDDTIAFSDSKTEIWDRFLFLIDLKKAQKGFVKSLPLGLVEKDKQIFKASPDEYIVETPDGSLIKVKKNFIYGTIKD